MTVKFLGDMFLQGYSLPSHSGISIFDQMKNLRLLRSNHLGCWEGGILSTAMMPKEVPESKLWTGHGAL